MLMTEGTGRKILAALNLARDPNDRLRVIVDGGALNTTAVQRVNATIGDSNSGNGIPLYYSIIGSPWSMDPREQHRLSSVQAAQIRRQRWTIT